MQHNTEKNLLLDEIDILTQQAQQLKRDGKVSKAIRLLEKGIQHYQKNNNVPPEGVAALSKSVAKLYYLQGEIELSEESYIQAIDMFKKAETNHDQQVQVCYFHLGCCDKKFMRSELALLYNSQLKSGEGLPPGHPDSLFSQEKVVEITKAGIEMYDWHKKFQLAMGPSFSEVNTRNTKLFGMEKWQIVLLSIMVLVIACSCLIFILMIINN